VNWQAPAHCRGLVFDCDGTVVDNMPLHYEAWSKTLERHGLHLEESRFYSWAGRPIADIIGQLSAEQRVSVDTQQVTQEYEHYFHNMPLHRLRPVRPVVEIARRFRGRL
jgi:beta-phosphoglucomutase-like phosphatase (HAD superfamily)